MYRNRLRGSFCGLLLLCESVALLHPIDVHAAATKDEIPCETSPEGMSCVPAGSFIRGSDEDSHWPCYQYDRRRDVPPDSAPASRVWVQTFYMDQTEVTYAAYKGCVRDGKCNQAGPGYNDFDRPRQPITGISWYDADQYCRANGKHLPTEAEWEKAARGPDGDTAPWGSEKANCDLAVIRDDTLGGRSCGVRKQGGTPRTGRPLEVASRPAGHYGIFDMVGNVEEWTADWYSISWEKCGDACNGVDPKGPCAGAPKCKGHPYKSVRGGSWYWPAQHATAYHRRPHVPKNRPFHHFGFRCAASVEEARELTTR